MLVRTVRADAAHAGTRYGPGNTIVVNGVALLKAAGYAPQLSTNSAFMPRIVP